MLNWLLLFLNNFKARLGFDAKIHVKKEQLENITKTKSVKAIRKIHKSKDKQITHAINAGFDTNALAQINTIYQDSIAAVCSIAATDLGGIRQDLSNDFWLQYIDRIKLITDDELRRVWAKIIGSDNNSEYSKKTLQVLSNLEKSDIELFGKIAKSIYFDKDSGAGFIYFENDDFLKKNYDFSLDDLIRLSHKEIFEIQSFSFTFSKQGTVVDIQNDEVLCFLDEARLDSIYILSESGRQILTLFESIKPDEKYFFQKNIVQHIQRI